MPFSHHSHSGEFCMHAKDTLEEMIQEAIRRGMTVFSLTEHAPRDQVVDLYPEEVRAQRTPFDLFNQFLAFYNTALLLRAKYSSQIHLLVGCETEYIRPSSIHLMRELCSQFRFDFLVGSVHHVNTIPIDFDRALYQKALLSLGPEATEEMLFERYLDEQLYMLEEVKPAVVGHFDLIRLMSNEPKKMMKDYGQRVWSKVVRNLEAIKFYGGLLELNSAAIRKGWDTPYPGRDVCDTWLLMGGRFTFSDDSHGVLQVGLNYHHLLAYCQSLGIKEIHYLIKLPMGEMAIDVLDACAVRSMSMEELVLHPFWEKDRQERANSEKEIAF
ncbi:polymerase/histidinol phosphatase-like protein [Pyronema omphalodes]|nr:polymerase/histidinol phosphatase-like protein [Pyronema omphalodes]